MNFIRSVLYFLFQLVTVAPWSFVAIIVYPLPRRMRYNIVMKWLDIAIWGAKHILGIRWQVKGQEHLNRSNVILLSKHQSTWETFFYPTFIDREMCYVFKRELLLVPFFGWGIGLLDMIHINRNRGRDAFEDIVTQGSAKLAQGRWIVMFPEGTRIPPGQQGTYRTGGIRLAQRTGASIIPVAVNAGEFWPKTPFTKKPGVVTVVFGPPIECAGRDTESIRLEVEQWIETQMRVISPSYYTTPWTSSSN
jgi:1-acyl-sn-glycerol-3-phosphate acyltransferase